MLTIHSLDQDLRGQSISQLIKRIKKSHTGSSIQLQCRNNVVRVDHAFIQGPKPIEKKARFDGLLNASVFDFIAFLNIQIIYLLHNLAIAGSITGVTDVALKILVCNAHQTKPERII